MPESLTRFAAEGDVDGVVRLLEAGAAVDEVENGRFNATPLQKATRGGHLEVVLRLLARGANVNHFDHDGFSPVTEAARAGKWAVVKALAEHGADFQVADGHGKTGEDYLRRCRGKRDRAAIEAVLAGRGPVPEAIPPGVVSR